MNIIDELKKNEKAFGLLKPELKKISEGIGPEHFEYFYHEKWRSWGELTRTVAPPFAPSTLDLSCRLEAGYACKHPDMRRLTVPGLGDQIYQCEHCGMQQGVAPEMGWAEYEIFIDPGDVLREYRVKSFQSKICNPSLLLAKNLDGFGGIKYKCPGTGAVWAWRMQPPDADDERGPWIPVSVRFWGELRK